MRILVINPGSTSTKVAVYKDERPVLLRNIRHTAEELQQYPTSFDQLPLRQSKIVQTLEEEGIPFEFDAIVGRGGLTHPIPAGVYRVNEQMLHDTRTAVRQHVCNLGCHIAAALAAELDNCSAFIADPVIVDEMCPEARICGSPSMKRSSVWHALNQRATARRHALAIGRRYEELDLIVAHLGGGITIGVHHQGRTIDVNNGLDGEGPFSPERAGTLPSADLIRMCFSGQYSEEELLRRVAGKAGLVAWLGTSDTREILDRIEAGDEKAKLIMDAMIYHIAKGIAAQAAVLCGRYDAILITGGLAHADYITSRLRERVSFIAPVHIYPGENEMEALAENALAVLRNQREVLEYQ
ncbi:butyrate kinase [Alloprevotella sp. oral taxon 473]|uniref:butyrate kinase n=1 Tax=Alloprevotella sp. oral taxon 473 TaxID=712469 RepID=UPI0002A25C6E|nr:butyrate kinase [Alloprevotella sp. oral taxon 473]EKX91715.1 butyrate kinase [Alloprevotella sp. oral taxon 473 str. F0040]